MVRSHSTGQGKKRRRGSMLALMVILMLVLSVGALTAIQVGRDARLRAIDAGADIAACYAADAGVTRMLYQMNQALSAGTWSLGSAPSFTDEPLAGGDAVYTTTVTGSTAGNYQVTSTGRSKTAARTVRATVLMANPFSLNYAVLTERMINLFAKTTIKGFNSTNPMETDLRGNLGTLATAAGSISLKSGSEVYGDIFVGPDANPNLVVSLQSGGSIYGEYFNQPLPAPLPLVTAPSLPHRGSISDSAVSLTAADSGTYSSIDIANNGVLCVVGHCTVVVTGDIGLKNGAEIQITPGASLTIYLAGDFIGNNASNINNISGIPSHFKVYGTGTNQQINLKNSSDFYGVVYAPNASMTLDNGGDVYGSFIVDNFALKNSGGIYYDKALEEVSTFDEALIFIITRWEEL